MNPASAATATATTAAPQARQSWKERSVRTGLNTVKVAAETFQVLMFLAAEAKNEYVDQLRPDTVRKQKTTKDGVPVWAVKLSAVDWRGEPHMLSVSVPMPDDPAGVLTLGQPVQLPGLSFGVADRHAGGYMTWLAADGISAANAQSAV